MDKEREYRISCALKDLKHAPLVQVASTHAISRGSLRNRKKGGTNARDAQIPAQKLNPDQEKNLVSWILNEEAAGRGQSKANIRKFADLILKHDGRDEHVGHNWVNRFIARHKDVKMKPSRPTDAVRANETTEEQLQRFFRLLEHQIEDKDIDWTTLHNIDEHGVAEGETEAGRVVGTSFTFFATVSTSDSRTWVSIIECISACGTSTTPVVIFTGQNLQGQWFDPPWPDWKYDCTSTGWSNSLIFRKWFVEVFLPETEPAPGKWRLLILDGHTSHVTVEIMFLAWLNKVQLLYLPPHSSHTTQPLDVGIFAVLKRFFHQETEKYATFAARSPIQKRRFVHSYEIARKKALTERNIRHSFRGSGIYPVDVEKPMKQVVNTKRPPPPDLIPSTPKKQKSLVRDNLRTPKNERDVKRRLDRARNSDGGVKREARHLINQNGKQITHLNSIIASQKQRIEFLEDKLESQKPTGRKAVDYDPNERFARIEEIAYAHYEAAKAPTKYRDREAPKLQENPIKAAEKKEEGLQSIFQVQLN